MSLSEGQLRILNIVAEKSGRSVSTPVVDTAVIEASGLIPEEVYLYLSQLDGLGLVKIGIKVSGAEFRMVNIIKEDLEETSQGQEIR